MCVNYDPIRPERANLLGMPSPTFEVKSDVFRGGFGPVIMLDSLGQRSWVNARFGLVPIWAQNLAQLSKYDTWNAKIESIEQKRSYKDSWFKSRFCLVACERVYEPLYKQVNGKLKNHWYGIERNDGQPFTIAAIYNEYSDELNPETKHMSFSMLTIDAANNSEMSKYHHPTKEKRSVIQVPPDFRDSFLVASTDEARDMLNTWASLPADQYHGQPKVVVDPNQSSLF